MHYGNAMTSQKIPPLSLPDGRDVYLGNDLHSTDNCAVVSFCHATFWFLGLGLLDGKECLAQALLNHKLLFDVS